MPTQFEVNLGSLLISFNGNGEASYDHHEFLSDQLAVDYDADGNIVSIEAYGPMYVSTEKSVQRVAHAQDKQAQIAEDNGAEIDDETAADRADRAAAGPGDAKMNRRRMADEELYDDRGGNARSAKSGANRGKVRGSVVNPNTHDDVVADIEDSNARDEANGSVGRKGVAGNAANAQPAVEEKKSAKAEKAEKASEPKNEEAVDKRSSDNAVEVTKGEEAESSSGPIQAIKDKVAEMTGNSDTETKKDEEKKA